MGQSIFKTDSLRFFHTNPIVSSLELSSRFSRVVGQVSLDVEWH